MWNCPSCSKSVDDVWAYCPYCGGALLETCRECGEKEPIGRPICLTRLDVIKTGVEKHVTQYATKNKHEGRERGLTHWIRVVRWWTNNNVDTFCLATIGLIALIPLVFSKCVGDTAGIVVFLGLVALSIALSVNALIPTKDGDDDYLVRLKKEGMREYYKNHPEEYAMLRLIQANKSTPDITHVLEKILP